jgi:hypothetical protein
MTKQTYLILGAMSLATGVLYITEGRSAAAAAGDRPVAPAAVAAEASGTLLHDRWQYHGCFDYRHDAEEECRRLRHDGWRCKIERSRDGWCVYKRRDQ